MNLRTRHSTQPTRASATLVVIALVAIIMAFMAVNARTLHHLSRTVRVLEQRQLRLHQKAHPPGNGTRTAATNLVSSTGVVLTPR